MDEVCEVPVPVSSPACYTIEDDDEPEVIFIADNSSSEEDSRDGEPSSTTIDVNGDEAQGDNTDVHDGYIDADAGARQNSSDPSDASGEDEWNGNVLNDFIKLIDLMNSYEKHDSTVKTKFKDGFVFLENLQTQFEETERNVTEKNEMIAELIAENIKLKGDNKQLTGEINTQSLQFGMLKSKYVKLEEEMESLKISEKVVEEPPPVQVSMPTNLTLETMKSKADKLQQLFRKLCSKMSEERVYISDPESVKRSKELKSFQNEVGVLFIKVQHKLSKWSKNQAKMEEELERARMSLVHLHDMVSITAKFLPATAAAASTAAVVESSTSQVTSRKRKMPPPPLVPLHISSISKCNSDTPVTPEREQNTFPAVFVPNKLPKTLIHSPVVESITNTNSDGTAFLKPSTQSMDLKTIQTSIPLHLPSVLKQVSPPPVVPMKSSPSLVSTSSSPPQPSPTLYQLTPLPSLNFPLSPPTLIVSTSTATFASVQNTVCTVFSSSTPSKAPKVQPKPTEAKPKVRRRRGKTLKTAPAQLPQTTSMESRYPITPPQYSQAPYPIHPPNNPYPMSQFTHNGPHQATLQAYQNQMMQLPFPPTASQVPPQQQHQISSSAPPVSTQSSISPVVSIPEIQKQTNVTHQNKCQVCAMTFVTIIQLKLHHAVVHSKKTPSSAFTGPATTSPPISTNQQIISRPLLVPPPPLQERHQNAASLQRVPSNGQATVFTNLTIGTSTTTTWSNESNQKRHCTGLSPPASAKPTSSISSIPFQNLQSQ